MMTSQVQLHNSMLAAIEDELRAQAEPIRQSPASDLYDLIAYHMGWQQNQTPSGKRIRPLLTLLSCAGAGGDWGQALPAAAAIEWLHNFSLIHDDIEDQSRTRRGRETLWVRSGVPLAINTGDALFAIARLGIYRLQDAGIQHQRLIEINRALDQTTIELCKGQHLDMRFESQPRITTEEYLAMITGKTSALIACACQVGAILSPVDEIKQGHYADFGVNLGLAFQMQDDILGIWGEPAKTGKPSGDDLLLRKTTLPVILGHQRSPHFTQLWQTAPDEVEIDLLTAELDAQGIRPLVQEYADGYSAVASRSLQLAAPQDPAGSMLQELVSSLLRREN
ncbi:MAG: polyprenyl synthetase family protein [Anaerolineales bacterium]|jgi:geranylgeranyl diphosphate synthase type I